MLHLRSSHKYKHTLSEKIQDILLATGPGTSPMGKFHTLNTFVPDFVTATHDHSALAASFSTDLATVNVI